MYTNWFNNGIKYFEDVYDITAKALYIYRRLREKHTLPEGNFLKYLTLIHSIPNVWKTILKMKVLIYCKSGKNNSVTNT